MFPMEKAVWDLLNGNIKFNDNNVISLVRRLTSEDETPCITIRQAAEVQLAREIIPSKTEVIQTINNVEVWIDIWANTEEERDSLRLQVERRIFQALANHYTTCDNFNKGQCNFLDKECEALTVTNGRTAKNQCPYPNENQYTSWFKKYHIIKPSFTISGRQDMDESDLSRPVLRTLIKLDMDYYLNYDLGGHELEDIIIDEELL
ncbi:hypothetical protein [Methanobrevibacter sp.]